MKDFFSGTKRVSHTISQNKDVRNMPRNKPGTSGSMTKPVDLRGGCASCGKRRK